MGSLSRRQDMSALATLAFRVDAGEIPGELGKLAALTGLNLRDNCLTGERILASATRVCSIDVGTLDGRFRSMMWVISLPQHTFHNAAEKYSINRDTFWVP